MRDPLAVLILSIILGATAVAHCGCSAPPVEDIGAEGQALRTHTFVAQPEGNILTYPYWVHSPDNNLVGILGDYNSGNPNASYVYMPQGSGIGTESVFVTEPSAFTCAAIVSISSVTAQFKLHTNSANEQIYWAVSPAAEGSAVVGCGNMPPWQPVGTIWECGSNTNPITHQAWTKEDIACNGGYFINGYQFGVNVGVVIEAMQIKITYQSL
jgi:hypothetical protein